MKLDAECHLRINEVTDCGCLVTAMVRTDTAVPVKLDAHPVFQTLTDGLGDPYESLKHYAVNLTIGGEPATDIVPYNSSVELWPPVKSTDDGCAVPAPTYGYVLLRHLVEGVKAMPWQPCPEHESRPDRRPGDIIQVIASAEPGIRPYWTFDQEDSP